MPATIPDLTSIKFYIFNLFSIFNSLMVNFFYHFTNIERIAVSNSDKAEVCWLASEGCSAYISSSFKAHALSAEMILLTYTSSLKDSSTSSPNKRYGLQFGD